MRKQLLITFDYELFLGRRSGTPEQCMIRPTNLVLEVLQKHKIRNAIFFVDTTYLLRLKQQNDPKCIDDFRKIGDQLRTILKQGHFIFPHLHPHWIDAVFLQENSQWDLSDIRHYRLSSLEPEVAHTLFMDSVDLLKDMCGEELQHPLDGYRAGGWCIQPFSFFEPLFRANGIKNDFSVLAGAMNTAEYCYYDFSKTPQKGIYRFGRDIAQENANGEFTEFSISSIQTGAVENLYNRIVLKFLSAVKNINFGDGISNTSSSGGKQVQSGEMAAIELLTRARLRTYIKFFKNNRYMHFISHPKMLSLHNIKMFDRFLENILERGEVETNYKNMLINAGL